MREILFSGKRKDNGDWVKSYKQWVEGSLIHIGDFCAILEKDCEEKGYDYTYLDAELGVIDGQAIPVLPETVRQYVCRDDINGRKIFTGDIVRFQPNPNGHGLNNVSIVIDANTITKSGLGALWWPRERNDVEVIGNIYDNPDLVMEGAADLYKFYHGLGASTVEDVIKKVKEAQDD